MRKVNRSALVPFSATDMYALVNDIESYPEFLPWCRAAIVHDRRDDVVEATLEVHRTGIRKSFRTRNSLVENEQINIALRGGPFSYLSGRWQFEQLADDGCKVSLVLEFEFEHRLTSFLFGPIFEEISNSLVDAFTRRAKDVYSAKD